MTKSLVLDKRACTQVLGQLAERSDTSAGQLYARLMGAWGHRPDRERITFGATTQDMEVLQALNLPPSIIDPSLLQSGWRAVYRHPKNSNWEVTVTTQSKPPKRRTFTFRGGVHRLVRQDLQRINKEAQTTMATKTKKKKAVEEDELDELEALEDLDDLDEDEDVDEPDDEDEEDEEEEPPKRSRAKKGKAKTKRKVVEDDDDEDEDDEDEDDEPAPRKKGKSRQAQAKTKAKSSGKGKAKRQPPEPRPLAAGRLSPQDIAEMADVDPRTVRVFLRGHADEMGLEKEEGEFRWSFNKRDAQRIVKALKKRGE